MFAEFSSKVVLIWKLIFPRRAGFNGFRNYTFPRGNLDLKSNQNGIIWDLWLQSIDDDVFKWNLKFFKKPSREQQKNIKFSEIRNFLEASLFMTIYKTKKEIIDKIFNTINESNNITCSYCHLLKIQQSNEMFWEI